MLFSFLSEHFLFLKRRSRCDVTMQPALTYFPKPKITHNYKRIITYVGRKAMQERPLSSRFFAYRKRQNTKSFSRNVCGVGFRDSKCPGGLTTQQQALGRLSVNSKSFTVTVWLKPIAPS
jgi:hypothetical protein